MHNVEKQSSTPKQMVQSADLHQAKFANVLLPSNKLQYVRYQIWHNFRSTTQYIQYVLLPSIVPSCEAMGFPAQSLHQWGVGTGG